MRDIVLLSLGNEEQLVIAADNAGGIGEKHHDTVSVPYSVVSYYTSRVALMECMAVRAKPEVIVVQNFSGESAYQSFLEGIQQACKELCLNSVSVTGSSETNFSLLQSCLGVTVIGKAKAGELKLNITPRDARFAVIGMPLVGEDVILQQQHVLPLSLFAELVAHSAVHEIVPVGSKGVLYELKGILDANNVPYTCCKSAVDLYVSSGPATSIVISYDKKEETALRKLCGTYFYPITIE
jgi:hypothetical protein